MLVCSILFLAFQIFYFFEAKLIRLDSIPIAIETILIFIYIIYFFYEFSKKTTGEYIYYHYCFWISIGILLYLGGSFFFNILINNLNPQEVETFGKMTFIAEILKNILFALAIYFYSRFPVVKIKSRSFQIPNLDMV